MVDKSPAYKELEEKLGQKEVKYQRFVAAVLKMRELQSRIRRSPGNTLLQKDVIKQESHVDRLIRDYGAEAIKEAEKPKTLF